MSLNPPLKPLVRGVRIARVITTSSAFLEVLLSRLACVLMTPKGFVYIADNPEEPGVRCLRIELSLSPAILKRIEVCGCE